MFKKLTAILLGVMMLAAPALAVDQWHTANGVTVKWDPVTAYCCDDPPVSINETETITYRVYRADMNKGNMEVVWEGTDVSCYIILSRPGRHLIGVDARIVAEGIDFAPSAIAWSDDPAVVDPTAGTFAVLYFGRPNPPINLSK